MQQKTFSKILSLRHHKTCSHVLTTVMEFKFTHNTAKDWRSDTPAMPLKSSRTLSILLGCYFIYIWGLRLILPRGSWGQSLGEAGPHQDFHKKSADKTLHCYQISLFLTQYKELKK